MKNLQARWTFSVIALLSLTSFANASICNYGIWKGPNVSMPPGESMYCSASWLFQAECSGEDMVYSWTAAGSNAGGGNEKYPGSWHILPWESQPIIVRGIELTVIDGPPPIWLMAGNGVVPDAMLFVGRGEYHARHDFPANTGMPLMAKGEPLSSSQYFDLHGVCPAGGGVEKVIYTVYYTVQ